MKRYLYPILVSLLLAVSALAANDKDPTKALLEALGAQATTPAERASVELHQADLERALPVDGLVQIGLVTSRREAVLLRVGMAYSDFGKVTPFKEWLTKKDGFTLDRAADGVVNPSRELYAILQGKNGAIWKELPEERRKYYEPLLEMMGGPVLNPTLSHADALKAATTTPALIGYFHEWQGVLSSYLDARQAIEKGTGPLAGTVRDLGDYRVVFETIYGHNGSGPARQEFVDWFEAKYRRAPKEFEIPFWTRLREMVVKGTGDNGIDLFAGSLQKDRYAGSERRSARMKYAVYHKILDRIDGVIHPEKIFKEIPFLGARGALVEAYFGGNFLGSVNLQRYTIEREIPALERSGHLTADDAKLLTEHAENQIRLAQKAYTERASRIRFYAGDEEIPALEAQARVNEITHVGILRPGGEVRFERQLRPSNGTSVEEWVDGSGRGLDFDETFRAFVFDPAFEAVTRDPRYLPSGRRCPFDGYTARRAGMIQFFS